MDNKYSNQANNMASNATDGVEKKAADMTKQAGDFASKATAKFNDFSKEAGDRASAFGTQISDSAGQVYDLGRRQVVQNPGMGVAAAATIGFLAGALLTSALSRRND